MNSSGKILAAVAAGIAAGAVLGSYLPPIRVLKQEEKLMNRGKGLLMV
jgi:hypothetical protein